MFFEEQFPPRISFGARGGPMFSTAVARTASGRRSVNRNFEFPLHDYEASQAVKSEEEFEEVRAFFYNVFGQFDGFRYKDWADYKATRANTAIDGDQLLRRYTFGSRTFDRVIQKPVPGSVVLYDAGGAPVAATVDYTNGTFTTGGAPVTWSGEFDVPCCFMTDLLTAEIISKEGTVDGEFILTWASIPIREIRL